MTQRPGNLWKFDQRTAERILLSIRTGNYMETAAAAAGISKMTMLDWLRRGARRGAPPDLAKFARDFAQAEAESEEMMIASVTKAGQKFWQASAWKLERRFPRRWARKDRVEHSSPGGGPLPTSPPAQVVLVLPTNGRDVEEDPTT